MKISIESVSFNQDLINYMNLHGLELCGDIKISCNRYFDLIISGSYDDLYNLLFDWGYIDNNLSKDAEIEELDMYFID